MELSYYLKTYPCKERPGHRLLFSTRKASLVLLKEEAWQKIEQGGLSPPDEALLKKLGMVVEDREKEKQAVLGLLDELNARNTGVHVTVVLNLDCNFSCLYCYEGEMKGRLYMSAATAGGLIEFIKKKFTRDKTSLLLDFYGGEPLLSPGLIDSIAQSLRSFTESRGASFCFTLVTNGSLFKRKVAERLVPLGLESVKITLDGPAENHNRYRPFKSGAGSFDTIIKNIKETWDLAKISIGGNFAKTNYEKFPRLLDCLIKEGLTPEKVSAVKFDPVMKSPKGRLSPLGYKGGCMSVNEPWIIKAASLLREEILKRGYNTPKTAPVFCMVENQDAFVVNFDGVIYKCPAFIGREEFAVGDLQCGIKDYARPYQLNIWKNAECAECVYLPLCFGGCRYMTFIRHGAIDQVDCKKAFLDASLETLIKQDLTYRTKTNSP